MKEQYAVLSRHKIDRMEKRSDTNDYGEQDEFYVAWFQKEPVN